MISSRRHLHWLIALLVTAFIGQSLAVVAMPSDASLSSYHKVEMDHSMMGMHHDMSQMDQSQGSLDVNPIHDCCKTMEHCTASSCSVPALSYSLSVGVLIN